MLGALQILGCCTPSTVPIYSEAFPGEGKMVFTGEANVAFSLDVTNFYKSATASTPCDSYSVLLYLGTYGEFINSTASISQTSSALTAADQGSYAGGIRWKYYSGNITVTDKILSNTFNSTVNIGSKAKAYDPPVFNPVHYATIHCDDPVTLTAIPTRFYTTANQDWTSSVSFYWLGVAQRDLPGIRLKVLTGSFTWFVKVSGGVVTVYTSDGTKTFSTSGTLNAVANAINASSVVNTWIQARPSGWQTTQYLGSTGETNGTLASGKTEFDYVFTRNDPSTMLKDMGPTYINVICSDTYAPTLWQTSTRLPIYERGDVLPPRGIVQMRTLDSVDVGFNTLYATYPAFKLYDNTAAGALSFITDPIYLTSDRAWGADVTYSNIDESVSVGAGTKFADIWNNSSYSRLGRYNNGAVNFNKTLNYNFYPWTLTTYNETFFGTCNYCQSYNPSAVCYQPTCPVPDVCSSGCMPNSGCDFGACGVTCFQSSCYYIGDPGEFTPSCASNSGCINNYSYYTLGQTVTLTPPSSGAYTASVATNARFI